MFNKEEKACIKQAIIEKIDTLKKQMFMVLLQINKVKKNACY